MYLGAIARRIQPLSRARRLCSLLLRTLEVRGKGPSVPFLREGRNRDRAQLELCVFGRPSVASLHLRLSKGQTHLAGIPCASCRVHVLLEQRACLLEALGAEEDPRADHLGRVFVGEDGASGNCACSASGSGRASRRKQGGERKAAQLIQPRWKATLA